MTKSESRFISGISELVVLRLLAAREMYGYELAKAIAAAGGHELRMGEGLLYPLLHVLESQGILQSRRRMMGGRPRIYYRLSAKGQRRLERLTMRWRGVSKAVNAVLEPTNG